MHAVFAQSCYLFMWLPVFLLLGHQMAYLEVVFNFAIVSTSSFCMVLDKLRWDIWYRNESYRSPECCHIFYSTCNRKQDKAWHKSS